MKTQLGHNMKTLHDANVSVKNIKMQHQITFFLSDMV